MARGVRSQCEAATLRSSSSVPLGAAHIEGSAGAQDLEGDAVVDERSGVLRDV